MALQASRVALVLMLGFLVWTAVDQPHGPVKISAQVVAALVLAALAGACVNVGRHRDGRAFALSAAAIALLFTSLFCELFPYALPSTTSHSFSLSLAQAASHSYTLTVMTVVAALLVPVVLAYQGWTYWVFRHRLAGEDFAGGAATPLEALQRSRAADPSGDGGGAPLPRA